MSSRSSSSIGVDSVSGDLGCQSSDVLGLVIWSSPLGKGTSVAFRIVKLPIRL